MKTIVFTGGGSGGHIFPGLAVVDELRSKSKINIVWIGSSKGIDRELVESHGTSFVGIPSGKLRRYFDIHNFIDIFCILAGFFKSILILLKLKPALVFSKGGFVSVPPCLAARILRIPVITHECDFSPGLATRINAGSASDIFVSYESTTNMFPEKFRNNVTVTGNPVRPTFYSADPKRGRDFLGCAGDDSSILFVQGGSLGARQINELVSQCIDELCARYIVVHQTGQQNVDQMIHSANPLVRTRYKPYAFIKSEMPDVLAASALVIARSGANTVWECAAAGKPMILIPLDKGSSRGDQIENAQYFVSAGAAIMLTGDDATPQRLAETVRRISENNSVLSDMTANSSALGTVNPAVLIASLLIEKMDKISGGKI